MKKYAVIVSLLLSVSLFAQDKTPVTFDQKISGLKPYKGFFTFYWDEKSGKIWLSVGKLNEEFLMINSLPSGLGSNDIGLDRGQIGDNRIVTFERSGNKLLLIQPNYQYRAVSDNADEKRSVKEAFAQSVLWGFEIAAEKENQVLVDATAFILNDWHNVTAALKNSRQGSFRADLSRSAVYLPNSKSFPDNTEFEATLTFVSDEPGYLVRSVTPTGQNVTLREHISFVRLPDSNYKMRAFDPRAGFFGIEYMDYATPISEPVLKRFISRHRLVKKEPNAVISEAVKPIVYYVDRGAPEPVRSALIEGASWWNQAFEAIGYKNAFRVEVLPDSADPMDVRYNMIQWVHRSTRGWSYGNAVTDPRTGEIIKGHVSLGSLRVRQDYLLAEGLLAPYKNGQPSDDPMLKMALARLRQLSAHEVGHTLGIQHNFAASINNRASVMDYPAPLAQLNSDGSIDLTNAYAVGIGEWDKAAVAYGYQDFPSSVNEKEKLTDIIKSAESKSLIFITDEDARPVNALHPNAHLWDNGNNAADELNRLLDIRAKALDKFGTNSLKPGLPVAQLEEVLVPLYLSHRYQIEAAARLLGGLYFTYSINDGKQMNPQFIDPKLQKKSLEILLKTLDVSNLTVHESIIKQIPPRPSGYPRTKETFDSNLGPAFDPLAAAEAVINMTLTQLLNPDRAARLNQFPSYKGNYATGFSQNKKTSEVIPPDFNFVINQLIEKTWVWSSGSDFNAQISRKVEEQVLYGLMKLANNEQAALGVRATAFDFIKQIKVKNEKMLRQNLSNTYFTQYYNFISKEIDDYLANQKEFKIPASVSIPAGAPIGSDDFCGQ